MLKKEGEHPFPKLHTQTNFLISRVYSEKVGPKIEQPFSTTASQEDEALYSISGFGKWHFVVSFDDKIILQLHKLNTGMSGMTDTLWRTNTRTVT